MDYINFLIGLSEIIMTSILHDLELTLQSQFFLGVLASLLAAAIIFFLGLAWRLKKLFSVAKSADRIIGEWNIYRLNGPRGKAICINLKIWKSFLKGGYYAKFISPYTDSGHFIGAIVIDKLIVTCVFKGNRNIKSPFNITFCNHARTDYDDYRLGVISGCLADGRQPYCSKILLSKNTLPTEKVIKQLGSFSTIIVPTEARALSHVAK